MDDTLAGRAAKLKARRETLLRDIDGARETTRTPLDLLSPATMEAFSRVMRRRQARNVWPCRRPGSPHAVTKPGRHVLEGLHALGKARHRAGMHREVVVHVGRMRVGHVHTRCAQSLHVGHPLVA